LVYFVLMKRLDLEKKLKKMNWWLARHGGKHDIWTDGEREVAIPRHNEINEYTAKAILREVKGDDR
jgi:mRNA interferase HicA